MADDSAKLLAARELIKEKEYSAARAVLKTIPGNSTAIQWLAKLDQIAPEKHRTRLLPVIVAFVGAIILALVAGYAFVVIPAQRNADATAGAALALALLGTMGAPGRAIGILTLTVDPYTQQAELVVLLKLSCQPKPQLVAARTQPTTPTALSLHLSFLVSSVLAC